MLPWSFRMKEMHPMSKEDRIRRRAYEIWEREGRPHGRDWDHWVKAAEEIEAEGAVSGTKNGSRRSAKKRYDEKHVSPGATGETIPPPAKPKRPRAKRTAKA